MSHAKGTSKPAYFESPQSVRLPSGIPGLCVTIRVSHCPLSDTVVQTTDAPVVAETGARSAGGPEVDYEGSLPTLLFRMPHKWSKWGAWATVQGHLLFVKRVPVESAA